jgi:hypothetical protein
VPCKGANANIVRCVYNKDHMQKRVYRVQSKMKMNGSVEDEEEKKESNNSPGKKNAGAV